MKKFLIITGIIGVVAFLGSCGPRRSPGRAYMPDMTYSRAYETYAPSQERLDAEGTLPAARYTGRPVAGTMARGDMMHYDLPNDSNGYNRSAAVKSPLDATTIDMRESERLYLVNCAICHGAKLDGNGPLYNGGNGPFTAAPKNLMADDAKLLAEGTMFHVVTYGKGQMGSYASQLNTKQRWMVIAYVKSKQGVGAPAPAGATTDSTGAATPAAVKPDSSAAVAARMK